MASVIPLLAVKSLVSLRTRWKSSKMEKACLTHDVSEKETSLGEDTEL